MSDVLSNPFLDMKGSTSVEMIFISSNRRCRLPTVSTLFVSEERQVMATVKISQFGLLV